MAPISGVPAGGLSDSGGITGHAHPMAGRDSDRRVVDVDGRRVTLTHLDKVLYPATGFTKGDVLAYYAEVADALVPLAAGRPVTRKRWPDGVGTADAPGAGVLREEPREPRPRLDRAAEHPRGVAGQRLPAAADDLATLTWLAQQATLEVHVPQWRFAADGDRRPPRPARARPRPRRGRRAARVRRGRAARPPDPRRAWGSTAVPVTSGSKGIHLYAALDGRWSSDQVTEVAHELARALEADHPDLVVSDMKKTLRTGKVLVDWSQNRAAKTTLVPYSLRGTLAAGGRGAPHVGGARRAGPRAAVARRGARPAAPRRRSAGRARIRPTAPDRTRTGSPATARCATRCARRSPASRWSRRRWARATRS